MNLGSNIYEKALITGISGQDRSYLAEFPIKKGYEFHGIKGVPLFLIQKE